MACGALGHAVQVVELADEGLPDPTSTWISPRATAWASLPADSAKLIDGLALPAFAGLPPASRLHGADPRSGRVRTGLPEETAQRLHATEAAIFRDLPRLVMTSDQTADRVAREFGAPASPRQRHRPRHRRPAALPRFAACRILSAGACIRARATMCCCAPSAG